MAADGVALMAVTRPASGRSAYVHRDRRCLDAMVVAKRWVRSLKAAVSREAREAAVETILAEPGPWGSRSEEVPEAQASGLE